MAVRREKIILEIEDRGSATLARMAGEVAALDRALATMNRRQGQNSQSSDRHRDSLRQLNDELERQQRLLQANLPVQRNVVQSTSRMGREFDRASGRVRMLVDAAVLLGPALVPIGAMAVPAITGLANQLGIAALAAGTAVVAFQGVGDAMKAMNEYAADPSLDNLEKVREDFGRLGPAARSFVQQLSTMRAEFAAIRDSAASGMFPQLQQALANADPLMARLQELFFTVGQVTGAELSRGVSSLGSERWAEFFDFLEAEAAPTMRDLSQVIGNTGYALAQMWMAFQPLNREFGEWLVDVTRRWGEWSEGLDESASFQEFVDYIRESGPEVAETLSAIGGMFVDIITATAPLGGPVLDVLEAIADVVSAIAESDMGTPILGALAAMTLLRRSTQATQAFMGSGFVNSTRRAGGEVRSLASSLGVLTTGWMTAGAASQRQQQRMATASADLRKSLRGLAAPTAIVAGLGVAASGAADGLGLTNTVSLGLMGTMAGPWGAAVGAGVGLMLDFSAASKAAAEAQKGTAEGAEAFRQTLNAQSATITDATRQQAALALGNEEVREAAEAVGLSMSDVLDLAMTSNDEYSSWVTRNTEVTRSLSKQAQLTGENFERSMAAANYASLASMIAPIRSEIANGIATQKELNGAVEGTSSAADNAADALLRLSEAYDAWNDKLTGFGALTDYQAALDDLAVSLDENGATFDANTRAGQANRDALEQASQAAQAYIDSLPANEQGPALAEAREDIISLADAYGFTREEAASWAFEVGLAADTAVIHNDSVSASAAQIREVMQSLPRNVVTEIGTKGFPKTEAEVDELIAKYPELAGKRTTLLELVSASAQLGISNYIQALGMIPTRRVTNIVTRYSTEGRPAEVPRGGQRLAFAHGGIQYPTARAYATGGIDAPNAHQPELYRGGVTRIWGEPETRGEAYIPLANDGRRGRAESILSEVAGIFGGRYEKYATGGIRGGGTSTVVVEQGGLAREIAVMSQRLASMEKSIPRAVESGTAKGSLVGTSSGIRRNDRGFGASRKAGGL